MMLRLPHHGAFSKAFCFLFCLILTLQAFGAFAPAANAEETTQEDETVCVTTLKEFCRAFGSSDHCYTGVPFTVKLMNDITFTDEDLYGSYTKTYSDGISIDVCGNNATIDFNGHTITYQQTYESDFDDVFRYATAVDYDKNPRLQSYALKFILHPLNGEQGSVLRFTDSVGGGGVTMNSKLKNDVQLATVFVTYSMLYDQNGGYENATNSERCCSVIVDGGNFVLNSETKGHGVGTRASSNCFRGAFITDYVTTTVNNGSFTARGDGAYSRRELAAFGTAVCFMPGNRPENLNGFCTINGGIFTSDAYAIHHFDPGEKDENGVGILDTTRIMEFPRINGGVFNGGVGYVGLTYSDSSGAPKLIKTNGRSAFHIPFDTGAVIATSSNGVLINYPDNMTLLSYHNLKQMYVLDVNSFEMTCTVPFPIENFHYRIDDDVDVYRLAYTAPAWLPEATASPFFKIIENGVETKSANTAEMTVRYADYAESGSVSVIAGLDVKIPGFASREIGVRYNYHVSVEDEPAYILTQPQNGSADTGEFASAYVSALNAHKYLWQVRNDGVWISLTDSVLEGLNGNGTLIEGADSSCLRFKCTDAVEAEFRCRITGTDGVSIFSNKITLKIGGKPAVHTFAGGGYTANHDAVFMLSGKYFRNVNYIIDLGSARPASERFVTLDQFKSETGIDYSVKTKSNYSVLTLKNVPATVSGKYKIGYEITNLIATNSSNGAVTLDLEKMLTLRLDEPRPNVGTPIENACCPEGGNAVFFFEGSNMTGAEWVFYKYDEAEETEIAYTLDAMQALFPDSRFLAEFTGACASLTVENAARGMEDYQLVAYAVNNAVSVYAGGAYLLFDGANAALTGDVNRDGTVDITDVSELLNVLAGKGEEDLSVCDLNGSETVDITDVSELLNILSG